LAWQDELFLKNTLDVKENDEHALDFALPFSLGGSVRVITVNPALDTSDN
jgi:hypothetical protein